MPAAHDCGAPFRPGARSSMSRQLRHATSIYAAPIPTDLGGGTGDDMFFRMIGFALGMGAFVSVAMATITALP